MYNNKIDKMIKLNKFTEPVGSKSPSLLIEGMKWSGLERRSGNGISLLFQSQAYPIPKFRYFFDLNKTNDFYLVCGLQEFYL